MGKTAAKDGLSRFVAPQLAAPVTLPPEGDEWLHEFEFDGYRLLAFLDQGQVRLVSRSRQDWTGRFPQLAAALAALPVEQAALDGEVVLFDSAGKTSLSALKQAVQREQTAGAVYFAFDLLQLQGQDLTGEALSLRKQRLAELLAQGPQNGTVRLSLHMAGSGAAFFAQACAMGVPGVVSKRASAPYRSGRGEDWCKASCPRSIPTQVEADTSPGPVVHLAHRPLPAMRLTHPDRVLYPDSGITKQELVQFYADIAGWILPHLQARPLSIVRCPDGLKGPKFFQKNAAAGVAPSLIKHVTTAAGVEPVLAVADLSELLALVQISTLEIHTWGCTLPAIERPDRLVIDLDPDPELSWSAVAEAAREVRARLLDVKLESFLKTTGGKGLHVVAPVAPVLDWPTVKEFTRQFAAQMAADKPAKYTIAVNKAARRGKILIDYLRNARGATAVVAYSTRAQEGAPVSVPLAWDELSATFRPVRRTLRDLGERLANMTADPWSEIGRMPQTLPGWVLAKLRHTAERKKS